MILIISLENPTESKQGGLLKLKNRQYSYKEVVSITENFGVVLGEGGFGKVYLGSLKDQTTVAVKVLSPSSLQGYKEFRAAVHCHFANILYIFHFHHIS